MNRIIFILSFLLTMSVEFHSAHGVESKPDIVLIIVDDLNDWLGCLDGHPDAYSPNIDALAEHGMLFPQAYCNSPNVDRPAPA